MSINDITSLKEAEKYINNTFDDILAHYDESYKCIDIEAVGKYSGDNYITCLFTLKDFADFIKTKTEK